MLGSQWKENKPPSLGSLPLCNIEQKAGGRAVSVLGQWRAQLTHRSLTVAHAHGVIELLTRAVNISHYVCRMQRSITLMLTGGKVFPDLVAQRWTSLLYM